MRRLIVIVVAAVLVTSCGGPTTTPDGTPNDVLQGKCSPSEKNPTLGLAAIDNNYHVRVWDSPEMSTPRDLGIVGDDPFANTTGSDLTVVESVAISPKTCDVFVGACCEPVSGITFYDKENDGKWETIMGHLPAISPDGELLARVAYEELLISSVSNPENTTAVISLPKANEATMYRTRWINGDEIALSGFTKDGAFMWIARMSEGTLREAAKLSTSVTWNSDKMWSVGIVGVDESSNVITQAAESGSQTQIQYRYPESLELHKTDDLPAGVMTYVIAGERSAMVSNNGVLTVWWGNGDPIAVDGQYVWAG